eukprot:6213173-Pleurochrysis_carterae.AAC.2
MGRICIEQNRSQVAKGTTTVADVGLLGPSRRSVSRRDKYVTAHLCLLSRTRAARDSKRPRPAQVLPGGMPQQCPTVSCCACRLS